MTDRELLECAAMAIGRTGAKYEDGEWLEIRYGLKTALSFDDDEGYWNPLEDDGQALRLAVKLQLTVCNEHVSAGVAYCTKGFLDEAYPEVRWGTNESEVIAGDFAATRRAIVIAAAAIGEKMGAPLRAEEG